MVALVMIGFFALPVVALAKEAQSTKKHFDIPSDAADRSLRVFSTQSGVDVVFVPETVASAKANAVKGDYTPLEAARLLVAGTGLVVSQEGGNGPFLANPTSDPHVQRLAQKPKPTHPTKPPA